MKILIAPDKFKHSLTAEEACKAMAEGILSIKADISLTCLPMTDGGDGLISVISGYAKCSERSVKVADPLFRPIKASYLISEDNVAFIEMAKASGLMLLKKEEYNPSKTTTYGTGQLIRDAIEQKARKIILGIGGSATNDAGIGMAAALGFKFSDSKGQDIIPIGENLQKIIKIDTTGVVDFGETEIEVACDVDNVLTGEQGAAFVYSPQKGADAAMVKMLDEGLEHFSQIIKTQLARDVRNTAGAGAAGGLGAGCIAFLGAKLRSGIELILDYSNAETYIQNSDLIVTGEGKLDKQSLHGKVISGIAHLCKKHNKPLIALAGKTELSEQQVSTLGIKTIQSIIDVAPDEKDAITNAAFWLSRIAEQAVQEYL